MRFSNYLLVFLAGILLVLSGCGSNRVKGDPTVYPVTKEEAPKFVGGQAIRIINYYENPEIVKPLRTFEVDYKQLTRTAATLLEQGLQYSNVTIDHASGKSVKLRVHNLVYDLTFFTDRADTKITAELGNGQSITVSGHNTVHRSYVLAINGAIKRATVNLLKHQKFQEYMK